MNDIVRVDYREQLFQEILDELMTKDSISQFDLDIVANVLKQKISRYEVTTIEDDSVTNVNKSRFNMLLDVYCGTLMTEGKSPKTVYGYRRLLERFYTDVNKDIFSVNVFDIRVWLASEQKEVSMVTCENYRAYLNSFFTWLYKEEFIQKNPMINIPPIKFNSSVKHAFSITDINKLRKACDTLRERALVEFLLATGIRVSELVELKKEDIDMEAKRVNIREGKGNKQRYTYFNETCKLHLLKYLNSRTDNEDSVFLSTHKKPMSQNTIRLNLNKLGEKAKMKLGDVYPHRFRRTFCTMLAKKGINITSLRKLMGHANLSTTQIYIDIADEEVKKEYEKAMIGIDCVKE